MNKNLFLFLLFSVCFSNYLFPSDCCDDTGSSCLYGKNTWQPRPFSSYGSREIIMLKDLYDHPFKQDAWDGTLSVATEYMRGTNNSCPSKNLGGMPFWSGTNSMIIGDNDGTADLDAYQFGMGDILKQGSISLNPEIQQVGTDFLLHFTQYKHDRSLYFKIKANLGAMMIHSKLCEDAAVLDPSTDRVWPLYPSVSSRYQSLSQAFAGGSTSSDAIVSSSLHKPLALEYGRISCCKLTSIKLGDIITTLGYNIHADKNGFVGVGIKLSCPTGTVPKAKFIFEPIFGRAGHWGIGLDVTGHHKYELQRCKDASLDLWMQADIMHLTTGRKPNWRSFDLKQNGPGSKYMIVQFYVPTNPTDENTLGRTPSYITQAVNITTLPVLSSFSVEGSFAAMLEFKKDNWNVGLSFDIWGRSSELLKIDTCNMVNQNSANLNDFAVLGRQVSEDILTNSPTAEPLYYCEPCAQINKSQNRVLYNESVPSGIKDARLGANRIPSTLDDALDIEGASERRSTAGKLVASTGYSWNKKHYSPCVNVFAGLEFFKFDQFRLNMWSVGVHGALNF